MLLSVITVTVPTLWTVVCVAVRATAGPQLLFVDEASAAGATNRLAARQLGLAQSDASVKQGLAHGHGIGVSNSPGFAEDVGLRPDDKAASVRLTAELSACLG